MDPKSPDRIVFRASDHTIDTFVVFLRYLSSQEILVSKVRQGYAIVAMREKLDLSFRTLGEELTERGLKWSSTMHGYVSVFERIQKLPLLLFSQSYSSVRDISKETFNEIESNKECVQLCMVH